MSAEKSSIPGFVMFIFIWMMVCILVNIGALGPFAIMALIPSIIPFFLAFRVLMGDYRCLWTAYVLTVVASLLAIISIVYYVHLYVYYPRLDSMIASLALLASLGVFIPTLFISAIGEVYAYKYGLTLPITIAIIITNIIIYLVIRKLLGNKEVKEYFKISLES
ncbi:MAG: hypothetical protein NDF53_02335 [archaeon GB-1867-097]|nr:hypothetical protein [Candidatus Culexmicrobium thermophilum]MCS7384551.1 hypothetical protein [Candidatus Culexmicrobium thermophilum]RLE52762.1 MAG: hypothetical protein DRJ30_07530 [Candidatus Verstraetearchaeota archaeon]HDO20413.1 hypothetical protein [Candidatus Bathyarchaeota archaeon]